MTPRLGNAGGRREIFGRLALPANSGESSTLTPPHPHLTEQQRIESPMQHFLDKWHDAALISLGSFWMAFWAFVLGYVISSCVQVFVTRQRMKQAIGQAGGKSIALATFFGFISNSCSFAALSTSKSLFKKGAGLAPALAFLLASTNLVIELGIIIAVFLSWQFVVGEYVGGLLLILLMWIVVKLTLPKSLEEAARNNVDDEDDERDGADWKQRITSVDGWRRVARQYLTEWGMVWRDVTFGFTIAGGISAFVPLAFFTTLFVGAGGDSDPAFRQVLLQSLVGPLAAFFTSIGSMGNIPLAFPHRKARSPRTLRFYSARATALRGCAATFCTASAVVFSTAAGANELTSSGIGWLLSAAPGPVGHSDRAVCQVRRAQRFQVKHRRAVECVDLIDGHHVAVDRQDPTSRQSDQIGTDRRAARENARQRVGWVAARMHL